MPRRLDHLVICVHDLAKAALNWQTLGFTLTPTGVHPFGTSNRLAMFGNNFLELLAVTDAAAVPPAESGRFNFAAHHQDFLKTAEGMSMLAFHSTDAPMPMQHAFALPTSARMRRLISAVTRYSQTAARLASRFHLPLPPIPRCPGSPSSPASNVIRRNCSGRRNTSTIPTARCA
jgi:hypothetical protein